MTYSQEKPQRWERLGQSLWRFNYNIFESEKGWCFESAIFDHIPSYGEIVDTIIRSQYPAGEENAVQRKGIVNPQCFEFVQYNFFVESIKNEIKEYYHEVC